MDGFLKQSTAVTVKIGKFVDSTDGNTAENGLTITQSDVLLSKNGGALTQKNEATNTTVDGTTGFYDADLDATDTNTLGILKLVCHMAGALYVQHNYMVIPANEYDSLISGSDALDVEVASMANIDFGATMKTSLETAVDNGLDNAIGGAPTAGSIAERIKTLDDAYTATRAGYLDELAAANLPTDVANVKAETALIVADTNELQTDLKDGGRLDLLIDDILLDTGTTLQNDITAIKAITDLLVLADIADAVLDEVVDSNAPVNCNTLRENINVIASAVAGKNSGNAAGTPVFRDLGDTKNRISATVDANKDRTAVTQDGT